MTECPVCEGRIVKEWSFCPLCGIKLESTELNKPVLDRMRYLCEREQSGKLLYDNFSSIKIFAAQLTTPNKYKPIRPNLGDYMPINLDILRNFSFPYIAPNQVHEMFRIGKIIGYFSATEYIKKIKLTKIIEMGAKKGLFWKVFENHKIQKAWEEGFKNAGAAIIKFKKVDKENKRIIYKMRESTSSHVKSTKPSCFLEIGCLCGQNEVLFDGHWNAREIQCQCKGDPECLVEVYLTETQEDPQIDLPSKIDFDSMVDQIVEDIIRKNTEKRKELEDNIVIIVGQMINYYLITLSHGHAVYSKHSGVICGERIAEKAKVDEIEDAFNYLKDLFLYLKAGILEEPGKKGDRIFIEMTESVYASGVDNIHTNLCIFLAGLMEGVLNKSTEKKWSVDEIQCIASGYSKCKFMAKPIQKH